MQLPEFNWTKQGLSWKGTCRQVCSCYPQELSPPEMQCVHPDAEEEEAVKPKSDSPFPRTVPEIEIKWCKQQPGSDQQVPSPGVQAYQIWMEHLGCCSVTGGVVRSENKSVASPGGEGQHGSLILILAFFSPRCVQQAFFPTILKQVGIFFPLLLVLVCSAISHMARKSWYKRNFNNMPAL